FGLSRVLAFEHSGRMRHTNEKHCVFARIIRGIVKRAPGMLLKHVVNMLDTREITLPKAIHAFVQPADRGTKRNAVVPNFSFALQHFERLPERVIIHLLHPDVVQLKQINSVCFQSFQRRISGTSDCVRRKVLRNFALPASARLAVMHKIVANFRRNHDSIPLFWERLRDQFFAQSIPIGISRIEQRDAKIESLVHDPNRSALGKIPPPAGRNRPQTKADFAHSQIGIFVSAKTHRATLNTEITEVTENYWFGPELFLEPSQLSAYQNESRHALERGD